MDPFWTGFVLGIVAAAAAMITYLVLAIAAMTMYRIWVTHDRRNDDLRPDA